MKLFKKNITGKERERLRDFGCLPLIRQHVSIIFAILKTVEQKHRNRTLFLGTTRTELHNGKSTIIKMIRLSKQVSPKKRGVMSDAILNDFRDYIIQFFNELLTHNFDYENKLTEIETIRKTLRTILSRIENIET